MAINFHANLDRRDLLKNLALGAGGLMLSPLAQTPALAQQGAAVSGAAGPRRVVFFLQNQGLHPVLCRPTSIKINDGHTNNLPEFKNDAKVELIDRVLDVPLVGKELPEHFAPLAPYVNRVTILQSLNGKHCRPFHSAGYGALAGVRLEHQSIASAETIDCALSKVLPAPFPLLTFGWTTLQEMQRSPICYCSSAWDRHKPAAGYSNPLFAHGELFGAGGAGRDRQKFDNDTDALDRVSKDVQRLNKRFSGEELAKFQPLVEGYDSMSRRRRQLAAMADKLRLHAPKITEKFTAPKTDLDWNEASFEVACAALFAGLTNVVTIASGVCSAGNTPTLSWGTKTFGHELGHTGPENPDWIKVHSHNMGLLVTLINKLEAVPEGKGTMLDNTLIVYTSDAGEKQHSAGDRWPFILIGNLGGQIRTGRYIHYPMAPKAKSRSINALYATILHMVGAPRDNFNLTGPMKGFDRPGPLAEILA